MIISQSKTHISSYLTSFIFFLTLFFASVQTSAAAGKVYNWRLAYTWPDNFPLFTNPVKSVAKYAKELSNGRLNITFEGATTHKKPLGIFDMVQSKEFEMGHSAGFYWQNKDVNTAILTTIPFGMIAQERYSWFYEGGGKELTQKVYQKYGLQVFPAGNVGMQMGGWFKKKISSLEDLKGLKMRIPGLGGDVMKAVGVIPTDIPSSKLYDALKSGSLEAVEWANPGIDLSMKLHDQAKFYYTGWQEPSAELQFLVNQEAYESLPKELQSVLEASMKLAAFEASISFNHANVIQYKELLSKHPDVQVTAFPSKITRSLANETRSKLKQLMLSEDPLTKQIISSQLNYMKDARQWTRLGVQAYLNNSISIDVVN